MSIPNDKVVDMVVVDKICENKQRNQITER